MWSYSYDSTFIFENHKQKNINSKPKETNLKYKIQLQTQILEYFSYKKYNYFVDEVEVF